MSIDDSINFYNTLVQRVFSKQKGDGRFYATSLENVLKELVKAKTGNPDTSMLDSHISTCKT
jgi:hypothetical protein